MPNVLIYVGGVLSGICLMVTVKRCADCAATNARKAAYRECDERQRMRTDAFNRGYERARQDYRNMSEVERFADTFNGRKLKMQMREVQ